MNVEITLNSQEEMQIAPKRSIGAERFWLIGYQNTPFWAFKRNFKALQMPKVDSLHHFSFESSPIPLQHITRSLLRTFFTIRGQI